MARSKNTLAVLAAITSLAFGSAAVADDINVRSMHNACRTDPALQGKCFTLPSSYASSITLWEYAELRAAPHGMDPSILVEFFIRFNGWYGATRDLEIPAGVSFRVM